MMRNKMMYAFQSKPLMLLVMFCCTCCSHGNDGCSPVKVNESCTLTCVNRMSIDQKEIQWQVFHRGKRFEKCNCSNVQSGNRCYSEKTVRYHCTVYGNSSRFTTYLTIPNVTLNDEGMKFRCWVLDLVQFQISTEDYTISSVYQPPESTTCFINKIFTNEINMTCTTSQVFPGLICEALQISLTNGGPVLASRDFQAGSFIYSKTKLTSSPLMYSGACSIIVRFLIAGEFLLSIKVLPDIPVNLRKPEHSQTVTAIVNITTKPSLVIEQHNVNLCPSQVNNAHVSCIATSLPEDAAMEWQFENLTSDYYNIQESSTFSGDGSEKEIQSYITFKWDLLMGDAAIAETGLLVTCQVLFKEKMLSANLNMHESTKIHLRWPPVHPPRYATNGESILNSTVFVKPRNLFSFSCVVDGGSPGVSSVHVTCSNRRTPSPYTINHWSSKRNVVHVNIRMHTNISCNCSADHTTDCYRSHSTILFVSAGTTESLNTTENPSVSEYYILSYATACVCGCGVLVLFVATVFFLKSKYVSYQTSDTLSSRKSSFRNSSKNSRLSFNQGRTTRQSVVNRAPNSLPGNITSHFSDRNAPQLSSETTMYGHYDNSNAYETIEDSDDDLQLRDCSTHPENEYITPLNALYQPAHVQEISLTENDIYPSEENTHLKTLISHQHYNSNSDSDMSDYYITRKTNSDSDMSDYYITPIMNSDSDMSDYYITPINKVEPT